MDRWLTARSLVATTLCLLLAGCWLQPDFNAGHTRSNPIEDQLTTANVGSLQQAWSVDLNATKVSEPLGSGATVHVGYGGSATWAAQAFDVATGGVRWDRPLTAGNEVFVEVQQPVTFVGDELWTSWVGADDVTRGGHLARLNPADGTVIEIQPVIPMTPPAVAGAFFAQIRAQANRCDLVTSDVDLVVGDVETSTTVWSTNLPGSAFAFPQLTVVGDQVFVSHRASGATAYLLDHCDPTPTTTTPSPPTCDPLWTASNYGRSLTPPWVEGPAGQMFAVGAVSVPGATDGQVVAVSRDTGALLWRAPYNTSSARIAVAGGRLYVATSVSGSQAGTLQVFDAARCGGTICLPLWTAPVGTTAHAPTVAGGVVYVAGPGGVVRAFDARGCGAATCNELVSVLVPGSIGTMSVGSGRLLVTSSAGGGSSTLAALAPTTVAS